MPVGPHPGIAEPFGRSDVLAAVFQVAVIAGALWTLARPTPSAHRVRTPAHLGVVGITAVVSLLAVVAIGGASDHRHGHRAHPTAFDSPSVAPTEHAAGHTR